MTDATVVETDTGPVRGAVTDEHRLFQGIPYAASTAGELRWRPPRPAPPWARVRDATRPGPMCPQQPSSYAEVASVAEDRLCLNVTVPRAAGPPRPVMVWIHGDGAIGAGSFFDARRLATVGDVLVGDRQLPAGHLRRLRASRAGGLGDLRPPGPAGGAAVGGPQRRRVRG